MLHDVKAARATRLALTEGVDYDTSVARRRTASRLCSPDRQIVARAQLTSDIAKVVRAQGLELAVFGAISTKTHVDKTYLSLGIVTGDDSRAPVEILADLVEPLQAAGVVVSKLATDAVSRMKCGSTPSSTGAPGTIAFLSIQADQNSLLNSLVASYTALSPDVLAPFIRAVSAIGPGKEFIINDTQRNQMLSFLCIAYLQSLASPLLPNLQSKDLIAKLKPPPFQTSLPVRRTHAGNEMVDTTFLPIGLTPPLREQLGWKQGTKEDQEFARQWIGKGREIPSLSDLVRGFYMVYGGKARSMFDWDTGVVAVRYDGLKVRSEVEGRQSWKRGTLVIQHPFVDTINLSAEVKEGPDEIERMFSRCLEDELLRAGAPPLETFMYLSPSHYSPRNQRDNAPPRRPRENPPTSLSSPSTSPSSSTPIRPSTIPPPSAPPTGSDQQGHKVIFENLPSAFDLTTFNRFIQASKLELVGPTLFNSSADGKPVGGIVVKDLEAALKLDKMVVYGQPISVKLSPSSSTSG